MKEVGTEIASVTTSSIERAARDLAQYLPPTPLQYSRAFTDKARCHVHIKIESIQPIRAFKVRGALTKVMRLHPEKGSAGVITASAGRLLFEWEHLLAEPAGAAALAALLYHYSPGPNERVVVVLSGANITEELMIRALKSR